MVLVLDLKCQIDKIQNNLEDSCVSQIIFLNSIGNLIMHDNVE